MKNRIVKIYHALFYRRFLITSIVIVILTSSFFILGIGILVGEQRVEIKGNQQKKIFAGKLFLEQALESSFEDLAIMTQSEMFVNLMSNKKINSEFQPSFEQLLTEMFLKKQHYYQLRFIDTTGMEIFRIERKNGLPHVISSGGLQDKFSRYYFQEGIKLHKGEFYVSPFDLNIEGNHVEKPYRPMIRICMPVFNDSGEKIGINVLNFDGKKVYDNLRTRTALFPGDTYLINQDGYYLMAPDSSQEWGFMFPGKADCKLRNTFGNYYQQINKIETGQFKTSTGLFTITSVHPLQDIRNQLKQIIIPTDYTWKLMSFIPENELAIFSILPFEHLLVLFVLLIMGSIGVAYFYTNLWFKKYGTQLQLMESERNLKEANATKNRFFSILSHDLKNSSMGISVYLGFVLENFATFSEEEKVMHLSDVNSAATQHNRLLIEIMEWARLQQDAFTFMPLNHNVREFFQEQADLVILSLKNKELLIEIQVEDDLEVYGDREMLKTIFRNLINNAIKFSHPKGKIVLLGKSKVEYVELSVIDEGVGMEESDSRKLFKLDSTFFRKGTQQEEGSGFGLKLVAGLVSKNNGKIHIESELGKGSSFIVSLPSGK